MSEPRRLSDEDESQIDLEGLLDNDQMAEVNDFDIDNLMKRTIYDKERHSDNVMTIDEQYNASKEAFGDSISKYYIHCAGIFDSDFKAKFRSTLMGGNQVTIYPQNQNSRSHQQSNSASSSKSLNLQPTKTPSVTSSPRGGKNSRELIDEMAEGLQFAEELKYVVPSSPLPSPPRLSPPRAVPVKSRRTARPQPVFERRMTRSQAKISK